MDGRCQQAVMLYIVGLVRSREILVVESRVGVACQQRASRTVSFPTWRARTPGATNTGRILSYCSNMNCGRVAIDRGTRDLCSNFAAAKMLSQSPPHHHPSPSCLLFFSSTLKSRHLSGNKPTPRRLCAPASSTAASDLLRGLRCSPSPSPTPPPSASVLTSTMMKKACGSTAPRPVPVDCAAQIGSVLC